MTQEVARHTATEAKRTRVLRALALLGLVLLPVLGGLVGYVVALVTPERYTAEAYVLISSAGAGSEVTPGDIAAAVARVATSDSVLAAGDSTDLLLAAQDDQLTAKTSPDAPLVELTATADSAPLAATLANDLAQAVTVHMTENTEFQEVQASTFAAASLPNEPSSPNVLVNIAAGTAAGLLLAAVLLVLRRR